MLIWVSEDALDKLTEIKDNLKNLLQYKFRYKVLYI